MDEVHIKNELVYDKHQGCLVGFTDLGNTNNRLLEMEGHCMVTKANQS